MAAKGSGYHKIITFLEQLIRNSPANHVITSTNAKVGYQRLL